jgi:endoglucanase
MFERTVLGGAAALASLALTACGGVAPDATDEGETTAVESALSSSGDRYFVPPPDPAAVKQIASLVKKGQIVNAARLTAMVATPQAVWFNGGTPSEVEKSVKKTMAAAKLEKRTPVLVPYNIPFRDCAQYSSGGAVGTEDYEAWITAFAKGIASGHAVVILEPDSLGIIPYNTTIYGAEDWCKPTVPGADGSPVPAPGASPEDRYAQLQFAVAALHTLAPSADVYLDGTHSGWLGVGEAAYRLARAGRDQATGELLARGFYLNTSNYQTSEQAVQFGTWVSMCTAFATNPEEGGWRLGNYGWCSSQYNPATGYQLDYSPEYAASVTAQIQGLMGTATASLPFVIDTSRNGRGPLDPAPYGAAPYNQPDAVLGTLKNGNWCNPPGAGLGLRPKSKPGAALVDAYLWVKIPGQSDGSCDIAGGARGWDYSAYNPWGLSGDAANHFDPLWGQVDPAAGDWFPAQALELAQKAVPPLL